MKNKPLHVTVGKFWRYALVSSFPASASLARVKRVLG